MNLRGRGSQGLRDRGQRLRSIDEDLDRVAGPRRHVGDRPTTGRRLERVPLADPLEASLMVATNLLRDLLTEPGFNGEERPTDRMRRSDARAQILR
jgi:hypothetical protein